jgi:hypothetical protein
MLSRLCRTLSLTMDVDEPTPDMGTDMDIDVAVPGDSGVDEPDMDTDMDIEGAVVDAGGYLLLVDEDTNVPKDG